MRVKKKNLSEKGKEERKDREKMMKNDMRIWCDSPWFDSPGSEGAPSGGTHRMSLRRFIAQSANLAICSQTSRRRSFSSNAIDWLAFDLTNLARPSPRISAVERAANLHNRRRGACRISQARREWMADSHSLLTNWLTRTEHDCFIRTLSSSWLYSNVQVI